LRFGELLGTEEQGGIAGEGACQAWNRTEVGRLVWGDEVGDGNGTEVGDVAGTGLFMGLGFFRGGEGFVVGVRGDGLRSRVNWMLVFCFVDRSRRVGW